MGVKDYTNLIEMWQEFRPKIKKIGTIATLLSSAQARQTSSFNNGGWKITRNLKTTRANLTLLVDLADIQSKITNRSAAEAFMEVATHPKYNHKSMRKSLTLYNKKFWQNYSTKPEFLMMFADIYNHNRNKKNHLHFATPKDIEAVANARMRRAA